MFNVILCYALDPKVTERYHNQTVYYVNANRKPSKNHQGRENPCS